ncbi:MAG TPA: hypothetical protein PLT20_11105 [Sedimentisphaerales bacterium]|nr:hypothetical protein [Phycisphaerae bacterium]HON92323.1 hypothetical protein [Sedimentisphaerales bacterium]HQI28622.1 hypothetical protein [Sedimentisphaerales bacterium]
MGFRTQHRHHLAAHRLVLASCLACVAVWAGFTPKESLDVGQRWLYRHEGPRPGSVEPNAIDGERIVWVLARVEGQGGELRVVEERFTHDEQAIARLLVRADGLLEAIELANDKGQTARFRYDPPIPYHPPTMAVGESRTISTSLRMDAADFTLPSEIITERLADETVATPAGEFADCRHYRIITTSTINLKIAKIPFTEEREQWYHPTAQGMVKEVYRRGPVKFLTWSRPGYTATSVLTGYDRQEFDSNHSTTTSHVPEQIETQAPHNEQTVLWKHVIPLATLLVLLSAGAVTTALRRNR